MQWIRHSRRHFGLFEKHRDYVKRAKAYQKKEATVEVKFGRPIITLFLMLTQFFCCLLNSVKFLIWLFVCFVLFDFQKLEGKTAFRNPDEFYFKMIKTRTVHKPE